MYKMIRTIYYIITIVSLLSGTMKTKYVIQYDSEFNALNKFQKKDNYYITKNLGIDA